MQHFTSDVTGIRFRRKEHKLAQLLPVGQDAPYNRADQCCLAASLTGAPSFLSFFPGSLILNVSFKKDEHFAQEEWCIA
jgi:hypothetical protein